MERSSVDGRAIEIGKGGDVSGSRVVADAGSMLMGSSVLGTAGGSTVEMGVGSNGIVAGVGFGAGRIPNEGSSVVASVGSIVGEDDGASPIASVGSYDHQHKKRLPEN